MLHIVRLELSQPKPLPNKSQYGSRQLRKYGKKSSYSQLNYTCVIFNGNCPGWGLGSEQAEGIRQGCRIAGQGVDDGPALLLGG